MPAAESPADRLGELVRRHPLPAGWSAPEPFLETVTRGSWSIHLAGLFSRTADRLEATGSAADPGELPIERAYFELLERTSLLSAMAASAPLTVRDRSGTALGSCPPGEAFPVAPAGASWAYARSNGVAVGRTFQEACRAAELELVERDRVLRSWYGETRPLPLPRSEADLALPPLEGCSLSAYEFPAPEGEAERTESASCFVVGVFGFPRTDALPMSYGFGAATSLDEALARAAREQQQRLGFLLGEPLPAHPPELERTADFHQETYLWPPMQARLRLWLSGDHVRQERLLERRSQLPRRFVDLTPAGAALAVVKALPGPELPLVFGRGHPWAPALPDEMQVHPIP